MNGSRIATTSPARSFMALLRRSTRLFLIASISSRGIRTRSSKLAPMEACGCVWDFRKRTVGLSSEMRERYRRFLDGFRPQARLTKSEMSRAVGALTYSMYVVPHEDRYVDLRPFHRLISRHAKLAPKDALPLPSDFALDNVEWWRNTFAEQSKTPLMLTPPDDAATIYVDASQWGVGLVMNGEYASFKFTLVWKPRTQIDPNWAELIAVEMALTYLAFAGVSRRTVTIRTDSTAVQAIFETGLSQNSDMREVFRRIMKIRRSKGLWVKILRVPSKENLADEPSRGRTPRETIRGRLSLKDFRIPPHLASFIAIASTMN